jgi:hypothetical protein
VDAAVRGALADRIKECRWRRRYTRRAPSSSCSCGHWGASRSPRSWLPWGRGRTFPYVSVSDVPRTGRSARPCALSVAEIEAFIALYAQAARNAIAAGFDGVEVHYESLPCCTALLTPPKPRTGTSYLRSLHATRHSHTCTLSSRG